MSSEILATARYDYSLDNLCVALGNCVELSRIILLSKLRDKKLWHLVTWAGEDHLKESKLFSERAKFPHNGRSAFGQEKAR